MKTNTYFCHIIISDIFPREYFTEKRYAYIVNILRSQYDCKTPEACIRKEKYYQERYLSFLVPLWLYNLLFYVRLDIYGILFRFP